MSIAVLIEPDCPEALSASARLFSQQTQIVIATELQPDSAKYYLVFSKSGVALQQTGKGAPGPISASFVSGKNRHRLHHGGGKGQLIAKAVGLNKGFVPTIFDATAGLGRDAFVLASMGCNIEMCERVPAVRMLLKVALDEALGSEDRLIAEAANRMNLRDRDSIEYLEDVAGPVADVIYLDPMYPDKQKSAAVKKEMRAFHDIVGKDADDGQLLDLALSKARYRVAVKRPRKGEAIAGPKPNLVLEGKSSRYDIYTLKRMDELAGRMKSV